MINFRDNKKNKIINNKDITIDKLHIGSVVKIKLNNLSYKLLFNKSSIIVRIYGIIDNNNSNNKEGCKILNSNYNIKHELISIYGGIPIEFDCNDIDRIIG